MLKCNGCGHEWVARNTPGTARQCSKCRSRDIVEEVTTSPTTQVEKVSSKRMTESGYLDDPEVREKVKELQIAQIERKIAEERSSAINNDMLINLAGQLKYYFMTMKEGANDEDFYGFMEEWCPYCNESGMKYTEVKQEYWGWRCKKCGKEL